MNKGKISLSLLLGLFGFFIATLPLLVKQSQATDNPYAVSVNSPEVTCGQQDITFTGTAKYQRNTDHLVILVDGNMVYQSQSEPTSWSTSPISMTVGSHTVEARVYDDPNDQNTHTLEEFSKLGASDSKEFTIDACQVCEQETWTCEECHVEPIGCDGVCYEPKISYCTQAYNCHWNMLENGLEKMVISRGEWVCDPCTVPDDLGFWMDDPDCSNSFGVNAKYVRDGVPVKDLDVEFSYMSDHAYVKTNSDGVAEAGFEYKGDSKVYAIASGFPKQELTPWLKTDCEPSEKTGEVLGASTEGQVLGASTMAQTGSADSLMGVVFTLGSLLTTIGLKSYAGKKN